MDETRRVDDRQRAACLELVEAAASADTVRPLSEQGQLNLAPPAGGDPVTHLLVWSDGADDTAPLAGYAQLDDTGAAELVVHPDHRRRGVATALLRAADAAAGPRLRLWAHGFIPAARAFAQARVLRVVRELWQMALPVAGSDAPTVALPPGFVAAPFTQDDLVEWVAVNARVFAHHPEQGRITAADVRDRMAQPWFDAAGFLLVRDENAAGSGGHAAAPGRLAAYHWTKIDPDEQPPTGEVYVVGIDPSYQGRGLARPLTDLGVAHLIGRGVDRVTLYVDGDNNRAIATYRAAGFERTALDVMLAHPEAVAAEPTN